MTLKTSDFYYDLPEELIAQTPAEPRDSSRLLVYHRNGGKIEHRIFRGIADYFRAGDVLVLNRTRVLPARLFAHTVNGGKVEVLLLKRLNLDEWEVLVRPGKKCKIGVRLTVNEELFLEVTGITESGEIFLQRRVRRRVVPCGKHAPSALYPRKIRRSRTVSNGIQQRKRFRRRAHRRAALYARTVDGVKGKGGGDRKSVV